MQKPRIISGRDSLRVEVYLIGYAPEGESVVLFMRDLKNNAILYSIVVDCYEDENCHKTIDILDSNGIGRLKLDVLCWTHPDRDHSNGIDSIITSYCNKETRVLIPYGLEKQTLLIDQDYVFYIIDKVFQLGNQRNRHVQTISSLEGQFCPVDDFEIICMDDSLRIPVKLVALSPSNEYIAEKTHSNRPIDKNELSIALSLNVGPYCYLMMGDVENPMIAKIRQDAVIDPLWLKIPHHSSSSSTKLIEILEQTGQYQLLSGTTVKTQSKLPNPNILHRYHNLSDFLHCTGVPQAEGDPCFGIIKYVFDLFGEFDVHITCEGNARVVQ